MYTQKFNFFFVFEIDFHKSKLKLSSESILNKLNLFFSQANNSSYAYKYEINNGELNEIIVKVNYYLFSWLKRYIVWYQLLNCCESIIVKIASLKSFSISSYHAITDNFILSMEIIHSGLKPFLNRHLLMSISINFQM